MRFVKDVQLISLISSWWSTFCVTLTAINWPCTVWFERNVTFFSAVSASCLVHFSVVIHYAISTPTTFAVQKLILHITHYLVLQPYKLNACIFILTSTITAKTHFSSSGNKKRMEDFWILLSSKICPVFLCKQCETPFFYSQTNIGTFDIMYIRYI
jgi:hypothetical protein